MAASAAARAEAGAEPDSSQSEAFQRLYPEHFYRTFLAAGVRPDSRPTGRARPVTIRLGVVSAANSSALVKVGSSTALAGIKLETMVPDTAAQQSGVISVSVEMSAMAGGHVRVGRPPESAHVATCRIQELIDSGEVVDVNELCIEPRQAAWMVHVDIYILEDNGSLLDVSLLAALAALAHLRLPRVKMDDTGKLTTASDAGTTGGMAVDGEEGGIPLTIKSWPLSLTCGVFEDKLVCDPTYEEEALMHSSISCIVDDSGNMAGLHLSGRPLPEALKLTQYCLDSAKARHKDVMAILRHSLDSTPTKA